MNFKTFSIQWFSDFKVFFFSKSLSKITAIEICFRYVQLSPFTQKRVNIMKLWKRDPDHFISPVARGWKLCG